MATKDYIVQSGDWLSKIAGNNNTTVDAIMAANPQISNSNLIYTGDVIKIPDAVDATGNTSGTSGSTNGAANTGAAGASVPDYKAPYVESDRVTNAWNSYNSSLQNMPGPFQDQWTNNIDATLNSVLNREPFSYDFNADPIYQQYKDQYTTLGEQAMLDTMGNAAALTGGYGNSYASTAGNQAYQGYLQQLNNVIPELTQQAYNRWLNDGEALRNDLALLMQMSDRDYGRHMDEVNTALTQQGMALDTYLGLAGMDWDQYATNRDYYTNEEWKEKEWNRQLEMDALKGSGGGGGGYSGGYDNTPKATDAALDFINNLPPASNFKSTNPNLTSEEMRSQYAYNTMHERYATGKLTFDDLVYISYALGLNSKEE